MPATATTYAESELVPLGYEVKHRDSRWLLMVNGNDVRLLQCAGCPDPPEYVKMGCPLHHRGPGGSWPVRRAKEFVEARELEEKREWVGVLRHEGKDDEADALASQVQAACPHDVVVQCEEQGGATLCVFCGLRDVILDQGTLRLRTVLVDQETFEQFLERLPFLTSVKMPLGLVNATL